MAGSQTGEALEHLRLASELAGLSIGAAVLPADRHIVVDGLKLHYKLSTRVEGRAKVQ